MSKQTKVSYKKRKRAAASADAAKPKAVVTWAGQILPNSKLEPTLPAKVTITGTDEPTLDPLTGKVIEDKPAPADIPAAVRDEVVMSELHRRWPATFSASQPMPLKIGIFNDLAEQMAEGINAEDNPVSKAALRRVLRRWTRSELYLSALAAPGAQRFDLGPAAVESVSDEHRTWAVEKLGELNKEQP